MTKILYLIPTLDRSGAEKQLMLLATNLPREEFDVEVVTLDRGGPYEADLRAAGIPVTTIGKRFKFDPAALLRLRRLIAAGQPDLLHTWLFSANAYGRIVTWSRSGPPVVVSERCVDTWKAGWQLSVDRRLIPRTERLIANSESTAKFYRGVGVPAERIGVIPNAVLPPPLPSLTREELLRQWNLPNDAYLVAYTGRLAPQKRVDTLLWAIQLLRQADPRACLLVIGDGPERDRLRECMRGVECERHTRFLGHREEAGSLLHLVDCFWLGSSFEGMSNSLMEALACGRPAVVSNIDPNRELVRHGEHGFLVDVGDSVGFAQYTLKLMQSPDLSARLGAAGRQRMAAEFPLERMVASHVALYHSVLERKAAPRREVLVN